MLKLAALRRPLTVSVGVTATTRAHVNRGYLGRCVSTAMEQRLDTSHYDKVPKTYHSAFFYAKDSPYEHWQLELIKRCAKSVRSKNHSNLRIADIGGGTGRFAHLLARDLRLTSPVLCVDPFPAMLKQAAQLEGVDTECTDAVSFVNRTNRSSYDFMYMKEVIHHIPDEQLQDLYDGIHNSLGTGGVCLTVSRVRDSSEYPFFEAAHAVWVANQPDTRIWCQTMERSGFSNVNVQVHDFPISVSMKQWADMIRDRFWSTFSEENFTRDELEAGIAEIQRKFKGKDVLSFNEKLVFVSGSKLE